MMAKFLVTTIFVVYLIIQITKGDIALLHGQGNDGMNEADFCITYNPLFQKLSTFIDRKNPHQLVDISNSTGCSDKHENVSGKTVAVARGECTFVDKALYLQQSLAYALLVVGYANDTALIVPAENESYHINITVAFILQKDFYKLLELGTNINTWLYVPDDPKVDPNMVLFLAIAVFCVTVGGGWAGVDSEARRKKRAKKRQGGEGSNSNQSGADGGSENAEENNQTLSITLPVAFAFFTMLCFMLVLLYFFYDYLVYVIIAVFCLAGSMGLFSCLQPFWNKIVPLTSGLHLCKHLIQFRSVILALMCLGFAIFWAVERKASYAWILQDILGMAFCINMIQTIRLPNLKTCTILLCLLFVYDIFFVFVTPLITKSGDSIMVRVATGGPGATEQLPMVFKIPRFLRGALSVCANSPSILGFGDVLLPGLLVAHNYCFDLKVGTDRPVYYIGAILSYAFGLVVTFVGLILMEQGQPALMYIVPITLAVTYGTAIKRRELRHIFTGHNCLKKDDEICSECRSSPSGNSDINRPILVNEDNSRVPLLDGD